MTPSKSVGIDPPHRGFFQRRVWALAEKRPGEDRLRQMTLSVKSNGHRGASFSHPITINIAGAAVTTCACACRCVCRNTFFVVAVVPFSPLSSGDKFRKGKRDVKRFRVSATHVKFIRVRATTLPGDVDVDLGPMGFAYANTDVHLVWGKMLLPMEGRKESFVCLKAQRERGKGGSGWFLLLFACFLLEKTDTLAEVFPR